MFFTGFSLATCQFWYVTVINVITPTVRKASGNTHHYIGVR